MRSAYRRLGEARINLEKEKGRKGELLRQVEEATSPAYIERVARDELGMQIEGETLVILSDREGDLVLSEDQMKVKERLVDEQNWEKWWRLIR